MKNKNIVNKIFEKNSKFTNFVNKYGWEKQIIDIQSLIMYDFICNGQISYEKAAVVLGLDIRKFYDILDDFKVPITVYNLADITKGFVKRGLIPEKKIRQILKKQGIDYDNLLG